jgi:hypothetical protein
MIQVPKEDVEDGSIPNHWYRGYTPRVVMMTKLSRATHMTGNWEHSANHLFKRR